MSVKAKTMRRETTSPQAKFATMRKDMQANLVERDGEIDVVLTALICREHPLLVGPPGTAKSLLLDGLMKWMHGNKFELHSTSTAYLRRSSDR